MIVQIFKVEDNKILRNFDCDEYSWGDNAIVLKKEVSARRKEVIAVFPLSKFYLIQKDEI